jgi:hypothetical protein
MIYVLVSNFCLRDGGRSVKYEKLFKIDAQTDIRSPVHIVVVLSFLHSVDEIEFFFVVYLPIFDVSCLSCRSFIEMKLNVKGPA